MILTRFVKDHLQFFNQISYCKFRNFFLTHSLKDSSQTKLKFIPVAPKDAEKFIIDVLVKVGVCLDNAEQLGAAMVAADSRGIYSHGLNRLDLYMKDILGGKIDCNAQPSIAMDGPATAWVDGNNGLGVIISNYCMKLAIEKARNLGLGFVTCRASNHYGVSSYYTQQAADIGMIGFSATNTSPLMAPVGAKKAALGTSPLSFAAPAAGNDYFNLDMTTSTTALGKIELLRKKGLPIPEGWAQDENGKPYLEHKPGARPILLPLGGKETGFKGYGLAFMIECLCGVLSGAHFGPFIRKMGEDYEGIADLSQCFLVINPDFFAPLFQNRLSSLLNFIREIEPADGKTPIIAPGDLEKISLAKTEKDGLIYASQIIEDCNKLAKDLQINPIKCKKI